MHCSLHHSSTKAALLFAALLCVLTLDIHAASNQHSHTPSPFIFAANTNPFILILGMPSIENATLTPAKQTQIRLSTSLTNNSIRERNNFESITLDGETYYARLSFRRGLNRHWEIGLDLPFIAHHSGQLDGFIKNWHDGLGLSNERRDVFEDNQLLYNYSQNGSTIFTISDNQNGWGDPLLTAAFKLSGNHQARHIALRFSSKLQLGDADKLTGNEASSFSVALAIDDSLNTLGKNIGFYGFAGYIFLENGEALEDIQRNHAGFASLGLNYPLTKQLSLKMQLDTQTSFYRSDLLTLGKEAVQLTVGGSIQAMPGIRLDFAIVENLATDTTPDVAFYSMLNNSF